MHGMQSSDVRKDAFPESAITNVLIPSWRGIMTVCR